MNEAGDVELLPPEGNWRSPCPKCSSRSLRPGPWPWYLGTVGMLVCQAVICNGCGHEFDTKKPKANLAKRKRNLALLINFVGLLGIAMIVGVMILYTLWVFKR